MISMLISADDFSADRIGGGVDESGYSAES